MTPGRRINTGDTNSSLRVLLRPYGNEFRVLIYHDTLASTRGIDISTIVTIMKIYTIFIAAPEAIRERRSQETPLFPPSKSYFDTENFYCWLIRIMQEK